MATLLVRLGGFAPFVVRSTYVVFFQPQPCEATACGGPSECCRNVSKLMSQASLPSSVPAESGAAGLGSSLLSFPMLGLLFMGACLMDNKYPIGDAAEVAAKQLSKVRHFPTWSTDYV